MTKNSDNLIAEALDLKRLKKEWKKRNPDKEIIEGMDHSYFVAYFLVDIMTPQMLAALAIRCLTIAGGFLDILGMVTKAYREKFQRRGIAL